MGRDPGLPDARCSTPPASTRSPPRSSPSSPAPRRCWPCSSCATHALSAASWDVIVVDCAPDGRDAAAAGAARGPGLVHEPRLRGRSGGSSRRCGRCCPAPPACPMPEDAVFDAVERLHRDLEEVQRILTEKDATVRLVLTPETRRGRRGASVPDHAVALRLPRRRRHRQPGLPRRRGATPWREGWVAAQRAVLAEVRQSFADLPIWLSAYQPGRAGRGRRPRRVRARRRTTATTRSRCPTGEGPMTITRTEHGRRAADRAALRPAAGRRPRPPR